MSESTTLFGLLFPAPSPGRPIGEQFTPPGAEEKLRLKLGLAGSPPWWPAVRDQLGEQFRAMFDLDVGHALAQAWRDSREIERMLDETRTHPGSVQVFHGEEQQVECHQDATLRVLADGKPTGLELGFRASGTFAFETLQLELSAGRVCALRPGACHFEGSLACGELTLVERRSTPVQLPGRIELA